MFMEIYCSLIVTWKDSNKSELPQQLYLFRAIQIIFVYESFSFEICKLYAVVDLIRDCPPMAFCY